MPRREHIKRRREERRGEGASERDKREGGERERERERGVQLREDGDGEEGLMA